MQFKSVSTGDYSASAKAVTQNVDSIYNTARETATDFTKISKASQNARTLMKKTAMKAEDAVNRQGMKEVGRQKQRNILSDAVDDAKAITRPAKRMAGLVAATGTLSTAYIQKGEMDRDAKDRAESKAMRQTLQQKQLEAYDSEIEANKAVKDAESGRTLEIGNTISTLEAKLKELRGDTPKPNTDSAGNTSQITPPKTSVATSLQTAQTPGSFDFSQLTRKDYEDLAFAVSGEAGPGKDKFAVAASILNRVTSDKFPNTVSSVIHAPGQYQAVYEGNSFNQPDVANTFMSAEGQTQLQEAFKRLDGRTDFKGQSQLHNRSNKGNKDYDGDGLPDMDIMVDPKGNFFHYHWQ